MLYSYLTKLSWSSQPSPSTLPRVSVLFPGKYSEQLLLNYFGDKAESKN